MADNNAPNTNTDGPVVPPTNGSTVNAPVSAVTVAIPAVGTYGSAAGYVAPTGRTSTSHVEKPEKFSGVAATFKRWQQKMLFYLTTLNLAKLLTEVVPTMPEGEPDVAVYNAIEAWNHADFLCRNYILNNISDALFNVYSTYNTAKELWESMDRKYKSEDAGSKKFVVGRFLDFMMVDSKSVGSQVQEFQAILHDIQTEGMVLSETFQVAAAIEKLPPGWKDFKNYLKHKRKEMSLEDLIVRLHIEEENRLKESKPPSMVDKVNMVEHGKG